MNIMNTSMILPTMNTSLMKDEHNSNIYRKSCQDN